MRGYVRWGCIALFIAVLLCIRFLLCFSLVLTTQCMTALHICDGSIHNFFFILLRLKTFFYHMWGPELAEYPRTDGLISPLKS